MKKLNKHLIGADFVKMKIGTILCCPNYTTKKIDVKQLVECYVGNDSVILVIEDYDFPHSNIKTLAPIKMTSPSNFFRSNSDAQKDLNKYFLREKDKQEEKQDKIKSLVNRICKREEELSFLNSKLNLDKQLLKKYQEELSNIVGQVEF